MKYLSKTQQEVVMKKQLIVELRSLGLTFEQITEQLNEQLKAKGLKEVCSEYPKVVYNNMKRQGEL
ncbi:peptide ABC transporter substrate-binding protein [Peribacillus butanolivorans]|uniref:peptide ABC transporter substrate-binding protein n=1 Tax=Peribacillus butanolivorans TaxID=421767 RepID=UPI0035DCF452